MNERTLIVSLARDTNLAGWRALTSAIPRTIGPDEVLTALAADRRTAAVILDADRFDGQCERLCQGIREDGRWQDLPILIAVCQGGPVDLYEAFAAGATDFLRSPVDPLEFEKRLHAHASRHARHLPPRRLALGEALLDLEAQQVVSGDRRSPLTPRETAILVHLVRLSGTPSTTEELLVQALGYPPRRGNPEVVRTHVRHLREKIEPEPSRPRYLVNVPRVGYRLEGVTF